MFRLEDLFSHAVVKEWIDRGAEDASIVTSYASIPGKGFSIICTANLSDLSNFFELEEEHFQALAQQIVDGVVEEGWHKYTFEELELVLREDFDRDIANNNLPANGFDAILSRLQSQDADMYSEGQHMLITPQPEKMRKPRVRERSPA